MKVRLDTINCNLCGEPMEGTRCTCMDDGPVMSEEEYEKMMTAGDRAFLDDDWQDEIDWYIPGLDDYDPVAATAQELSPEQHAYIDQMYRRDHDGMHKSDWRNR